MLLNLEPISFLKDMPQILNLRLNAQVIVFPRQKQDMGSCIFESVTSRPNCLDSIVDIGCDVLKGGNVGPCVRDIVCSRFEVDESISGHVALCAVSAAIRRSIQIIKALPSCQVGCGHFLCLSASPQAEAQSYYFRSSWHPST
jgi:hypothetical protein